MAEFIIAAVAVFFLAMGCVTLAVPEPALRPLGIEAVSSAGRAEIRAVYGGFGLAMAGVLTLAVFDEGYRPGVVLTVAAALGGMALGRVLSAVLGDRTSFYPNWLYFFVEAGAAVALIAALELG
jgi:hypothetical protein